MFGCIVSTIQNIADFALALLLISYSILINCSHSDFCDINDVDCNSRRVDAKIKVYCILVNNPALLGP